MDKRIDPNDTPLHTASTDPAFIPGITPAPKATADGAAPKATEPPEPEATEEEETEEATETEATEDEAAEAESEADTAETDDAPADDGPAFEASDRRGAVEMDGRGVRFRLDDQEAEFPWAEIGAVEHTASRFGRRLTVTVHTTGKRSYPAEVEAPSRAALKEWTARLDEVLDAHFEE